MAVCGSLRSTIHAVSWVSHREVMDTLIHDANMVANAAMPRCQLQEEVPHKGPFVGSWFGGLF